MFIDSTPDEVLLFLKPRIGQGHLSWTYLLLTTATSKCRISKETDNLLQPAHEGETAPRLKHSRQGHRRKRTAFSSRQLEKLETTFQWNMYPGVTVRESLATELGITEACVQVNAFKRKIGKHGFPYLQMATKASKWNLLPSTNSDEQNKVKRQKNQCFFIIILLDTCPV